MLRYLFEIKLNYKHLINQTMSCCQLVMVGRTQGFKSDMIICVPNNDLKLEDLKIMRDAKEFK